MQIATLMLQNIILKFEKTKKLFKKQTFEMDWFIGWLEKLYLANKTKTKILTMVTINTGIIIS